MHDVQMQYSEGLTLINGAQVLNATDFAKSPLLACTAAAIFAHSNRTSRFSEAGSKWKTFHATTNFTRTEV